MNSRAERATERKLPTPLEIARGYLKRGWNPIPVSRQSKKPIGKVWQKRRLDNKTVAEAFNGADMNVGVQLGARSGGLSDVDLDCREAVAIGPMLLPKSNKVFGRKSKPRSHWLYTTTLAEKIAKACRQFKDTDGTMMLELKIGGGNKGSQSVFPGSLHESGEMVEWDQDGVLVTVDDDKLLHSVNCIAVASLLARHWPGKGDRHDAALTVGGFLARAGLDEDEAALMLEAIATAASDDEVDDRIQAARDAVKQHGDGDETRGLPSLADAFGDKVMSRAAQWLGYTSSYGNKSKAARRKAPPGAYSVEDFYALMTKAETFIYTPTGARWPGSSVDSQIPPIDIDMSASEWIAQHRAVADMTWVPGLPQVIENRLPSEGGWVERAGVKCFNSYRPPTIEHGDPEKAGPWLDHVHELYPNEAEHMISWFACRVQRPDMKINHALALIGGQGIGKDTILEAVRYAVGPWNYKNIRPGDLFAPQNDFVQGVILCINEVHDLGDVSRYDFYDKTKPYITAPPETIRVNAKYIPQFWVFNLAGVVLTSNHKTDGLYLPADDRRHLVAYSELQASDFPKGYWAELWGWYERGGFGHVVAYLATRDISKFDPKAPPPKTAAFWDIVAANQVPEDAELADVLDRLGMPDAVTLLTVAGTARTSAAEFYMWLKDRKNRRTIPHRMEKCGYQPVRNNTATDGLWKISGRRQVVYARAQMLPDLQLKAARKLTDG